MRKTILLFSTMLIAAASWAQAPQKMSYQAGIRNSSDHVVANSAVSVKISILQGSATANPMYTETHTPTTDANGLISLEIGGGTVVNGSMSGIDWAAGPFFVKTETDPTGGTDYSITGVSQLLSVPYAFYAENTKPLTETDPVYATSPAAGISDDDKTHWNEAYGWGNHTTQSYLKSPEYKRTGDLLSYDGTNWVSRRLGLTMGNAGYSQPVSIMQPYLALNYCIALSGIYPSRDSMEPFVGEIELFAFNFAPRDYAACDGQLMSIQQYTALFSLIGTTYGGNGQTTFALPDLRGRAPIHKGQGPGLSNRAMGEQGGIESVTLTISQMPAHSHTPNIIYE